MQHSSSRLPVFCAGEQTVRETALDGVRYALIRAGRCETLLGGVGLEKYNWRLGALNPAWREEILTLRPGTEALLASSGPAGRGIWLRRGQAQPLGVMCGGLGAVWPGMGRELYDNFPAARAAMDRLAAIADWDVLALMDESDPEAITPIRWQIPYLFMLEYAQWSQFVSLGLAPAAMSGHSLGELIALCFAGVYSPEAAWYILDTRAMHISQLESRAARTTDMLVVHGNADAVASLRELWPEIFISNYNTPRQFILSGPTEILKEARKKLRRQHIPAISLNMGVAFHHPDMRVLRGLSLRRLNALEMHAPDLPVLSCVTATPYPANQGDICSLIADLDENAVRWVDTIHYMWSNLGIRNFLELGPQDILCGLLPEIEAGATCLSACRRGRETEAMREACARLFAAGYLDYSRICKSALSRGAAGPDSSFSHTGHNSEPGIEAQVATPPGLEALMALLARASGRPIESLRPDMDLRYDLALRSSSFPALLQEAENIFRAPGNFDDLLYVNTIADLARVLAGDPVVRTQPFRGERKRELPASPPLLRLNPAWLLASTETWQLPLPLRSGESRLEDRLIAIVSLDPAYVEKMWRGLAALKPQLALPSALESAAAALEQAGASISALDFSASSSPGQLAQAFNQLARERGRIEGIFFMPSSMQDTEDEVQMLEVCLAAARQHGSRFLATFFPMRERAGTIVDDLKFYEQLGRLLSTAPYGLRTRNLAQLPGESRPNSAPVLDELSDLLASELLLGRDPQVIWGTASQARRVATNIAVVCPEELANEPERAYAGMDEQFAFIYPDPAPEERAHAGMFHGSAQFSTFLPQMLLQDAAGGGMLSPGGVLVALLEGALGLAPWLEAAGFSDVHFLAPLQVPLAVTRECRVGARSFYWLQHDQVMSRMCRVCMEARNISATGRHQNDWTSLADGTVLLSRHVDRVQPIWQEISFGQTDFLPPQTLEDAWARLGIQKAQRLVGAVVGTEAGADEVESGRIAYRAMLVPGSNGIVSPGKSRYINFLKLVDAIIQAAWLVMWLRGADCAAGFGCAQSGNIWQLSGAGFIRFGRELTDWLSGRVELQLTWDDNALKRFDAQVTDSSGELVLTLNHLEFVRNEKK